MRLLTPFMLTLLLAAPVSAQVQLRFKFEPGEVIRQKMTQTMNSHAEVQGQAVRTSLKQTMQMEQAVDEVAPDGSAAVRQKISRIQMSLQLPFGQQIQFDSAEDNDRELPDFAKVLQQLVGAEIRARISPGGTMSDIKIPESLEQAMKNLPGSPFSGGNTDSLQQMFNQSSTTFPDQPVSKGESWSSDKSMKMPFGELKMHQTSTYDGTNSDGLHVIRVKLDMELIPAENQTVRVTWKDGSAQGTILFDNTRGQLVRSDLAQKMRMELMAAGQTLEQTMEQTVIIEQEPPASR